MIFLAHFSNTPLDTLVSYTTKELNYWYKHAVQMHNRLNSKEDE